MTTQSRRAHTRFAGPQLLAVLILLFGGALACGSGEPQYFAGFAPEGDGGTQREDPGPSRDPGDTGRADTAPTQDSGAPTTGERPCETAPVLGEANATIVDFFEHELRDGPESASTGLLAYRIPNDTRGVIVYAETSGGFPGATVVRAGTFDAGDLYELGDEFNVTFGLPNNAAAPPHACLELEFEVDSRREAGNVLELIIVTTREPVVDNDLLMNVVLVGDPGIGQEQILNVLNRVNAIFDESGAPVIGDDLVLYSLQGPSIRDADEAIRELTTASVGDASEFALNLFFVRDFLDGGVLGIAGGIPGIVGVDGAIGNGVIVSVDSHRQGPTESIDLQLLAETIAHELGHQMGLFHTTEQTGDDFDPIADTPECHAWAGFDPELDDVAAEDCVGRGADNLMFWVPFDDGSPQRRLSPTQVAILRAHPAVY